MRRLVLPLAPLAVLVAAAVPATAGAAQVTHFSVKREMATAVFNSTDPSGCVTTSVGLAAADAVSKQARAPTTDQDVFVDVFKFDNCTQTTLLSALGSASLARGELQIDRMMTAASLHATVTVTDFVSGTSFPVGIAVNWTGVGDPFPSTARDVFKTPDVTLRSSFSGTSRSAVASGIVSDATTNFTPGPAVFAQLDSVKMGDMTLIH